MQPGPALDVVNAQEVSDTICVTPSDHTVVMGRQLRRDYPGAIHHVMNRGVDRQPVFFSDEDRLDFGRQLASVHDRFGAETLAYCLMTNHYHLLLRTPGGEIASAMQRLGLTYTRHVNDRVGRDGPLFRGRYHSVLVESDVYLMWATRYIHRNVLDLADVRTPAEYRWSSYRSYVGLRSTPTFVSTEPVLGYFSNDRAAYRSFTERIDEPCLDWSLPAVRQLIAFACSTDDLDFDSRAAGGRLERTILILLRDALENTELATEIEALLDFPSRRAEVVAIERARRAVDEPVVRRINDRVLAQLGHQTRAA